MTLLVFCQVLITTQVVTRKIKKYATCTNKLPHPMRQNYGCTRTTPNHDPGHGTRRKVSQSMPSRVLFVLLVPPLFIEGNSHSYHRSNFVFAHATVPY